MFSRKTRKAALGVTLGLALFTTACASGTEAQDGQGNTDTVRVTVFPSLNSLGAHVAHEQGYFADEDLNVELSSGSNAAAGIPQMLGGSVDMVLMDMVTPIVASTQEVPLTIVAPAGVTKAPVNNTGFINILIKEGSGLETLADLQDSSVGIIQINSQPWMDTRAAVDAAGGDSAQVEFVEVPNLGTALAQDQVDAIVVPDPQSTQLIEESGFRVLGPVATEDQVGAPEYAFVTTREFAETNRETIERFQRALIEANAVVNDPESDTVAVATSYLDVPTEVLEQATIPEMGTAPLTAADLAKSTDRMAQYGLLTPEEASSVAESLLLGSE